MNYLTVKGKFICYGGHGVIEETLVCDGNNDCDGKDNSMFSRFGISSDESAYECAGNGKHYDHVCKGTVNYH